LTNRAKTNGFQPEWEEDCLSQSQMYPKSQSMCLESDSSELSSIWINLFVRACFLHMKIIKLKYR